MTPQIDIRIESAGWASALPDARGVARRAALAALVESRRDGGEGSLCIMLSDDASLRRLNRTWRGKDRPTNVLSFPAEAPGPRGDVALALGVLIRESAAQGKPRRDHLAHLVVHGVLHLLGHDHVRNADAGRMERLERKILARLGVPDPYRRRGAPIVL